MATSSRSSSPSQPAADRLAAISQHIAGSSTTNTLNRRNKQESSQNNAKMDSFKQQPHKLLGSSTSPLDRNSRADLVLVRIASAVIPGPSKAYETLCDVPMLTLVHFLPPALVLLPRPAVTRYQSKSQMMCSSRRRTRLSAIVSSPSTVIQMREVLKASLIRSVSPEFAGVFQDCIAKLKQVLFTETAQPIIVAGSGTLGWDMAGEDPTLP